MTAYQNLDIQIAVRPAIHTALSLIRYTHLLTGLNACRNLDIQLHTLMLIALAMALRTLVHNRLTRSVTVRAHRLTLEHAKRRSLLSRYRTGTITMRTGLNIGLTFRAASHTFIALLIHLNRNCFRFSENSIHELDAHLHEAVIPLTRSVACAPTSTTAKASAEKGTEDISEVLKTAKASGTAAKIGTIHTCMTKLIIRCLLLRITQYLICFVYFLERLFSPRILIDIRVIFFRHLPIGSFYFIIAGTLAESQDLIIISFAHVDHPPNFPDCI